MLVRKQPGSAGNQDRTAWLPRQLVLALLGAMPSLVHALPQGGQVVLGAADISQNGNSLTVVQHGSRVALDWSDFSIATGERVAFNQPSPSAVALNRVTGNNPTAIFGQLTANGQIFLINANGILFAPGASVSTGGLIASTLDLNTSDFASGKLHFAGTTGRVTNQAQLAASASGFVALLGGQVSNQGLIKARLGSVALAAGSDMTLDFAGDGLLKLQVNQGAVNALAENRQSVSASGGEILLTAEAVDGVTRAVVNNTGILEAQTLDNRGGDIRLLADMSNGATTAGGKLDVSAPEGGDGGFIETSGAHVQIADEAQMDMRASSGRNGSWLIDPEDFTIAASGGDETGAHLTQVLSSGNISVVSSRGKSSPGGKGDINIRDNVSWSSNQLILQAQNNINVGAALKATGTAVLVAYYGGVNGAKPGTPKAGTGLFVGLGPNGFSGSISVTGLTTSVNINGSQYTVIDALGAEGSSHAGDLAALSVNPGGNYVLGADIDATATSGWSGGLGWAPVGGLAGFSGVLDGFGHVINHLSIANGQANGTGLLTRVAASGSVRNLALANANVRGSGASGALAGSNAGSLNNDFSSGTVQGGSGVGGLLGQNTGALLASYSAVTVTGAGDAGGLVGDNSGTLQGDVAAGAVTGALAVGGLVGGNLSAGTIDTSRASGAVSGPSAGGLVGGDAGTTRNAYYDSSTVAINGKTGVLTEGGISHSLYSDWVASSYAVLKPANYFSTSASGVFQLRTTQDLINLEGFAGAGFASSKFQLASNIDMSQVVGWSLPQFQAAQLDGNGFTLSNLTINQPGVANVGMIGTLGKNSVLGNWRLVNASITGGNQTGGLVGQNLGTINSSLISGNVVGGDGTGGMAGSNAGTISGSYSLASVAGGSGVGGLVGSNTGTVVNSYSSSVVSGVANVGGLVGASNAGTLKMTYSTGAVSGSRAGIGGLVGSSQGDTVVASYWATDGSGQSASAAGSGLALQQMLQSSGFSGWDIDTVGGGSNIWRQYSGNTLPLLKSFLTPATLTINNQTDIYSGAVQVAPVTYTTASDTSLILGQALGASGALHTGSYSLGETGLYSSQTGYDLIVVPGTLTVAPLPLQVIGEQASSKTYDGTTAATLSGGQLVGVLPGDTVNLVESGQFASARAGNAISVTRNDSLTGNSAGDYTVATVSPLAATIAPAVLGVSVTGTKVFDGNTQLANPVFTLNRIGNDQVTASGLASFAAALGNGLPLTVTQLALSGADAGNYVLAQTTITGTGSITAAPLAADVPLARMAAMAERPANPTSSVIFPPLDDPENQRPKSTPTAALVSILDGGIKLP